MPTPLHLTCSLGNSWYELGCTHTETQSSPELCFLYLASFLLFYPFLPFITGLSKCTDAPFFTGSNYPSTPPLPAPHSAQIQKNSFHYGCVTKGHIRQCGVVPVSTDAFSGLTHPLAVLRVPLSTCTAPPFLFPCGSPALGIIFLCPQSSFPRRPSHPHLKPCTTLPHCLPALLLHSPPISSPHPGGGECVLRDSCCLLLIPPHFVFHREKGRWSWERRPRKTNRAF